MNNELIVTDTEFTMLDTGIGNDGFYIAFHAILVKDNFIYLETRPAYADAIRTRVFKINPYDLTDIRTIEIPLAGIIGGYLQYDKDFLYTVLTNATGTGWIVKINDDLSGYTQFRQVGLTGDKRVVGSTSFGIYKGKLYLPTLYNISGNPLRYNSVGWSVYDLDSGALVQELVQSFTTGQTTHPTLHWMTIFNDKIIASYRTGQQVLMRLDLKTLAIEEHISMQAYPAVTDDNTIFSDGYMYLNTEGSNDGFLIKVKYDDFTDFSIELGGYRSAGSINVDFNKPNFKSSSITNTTINVAQTAANLNTLYPAAIENFIVYAPNVGTGVIYHKTAIAGQWITIPGTTLNP